MTRPSPVLNELRPLLDALCEESLSPEQAHRLEELVLTYPEAEAYYVQYINLYADLVGNFGVVPAPTERSLHQRVEEGPLPAQSPQVVPAKTGQSPPRRFRLLLWGAVGASAIAAGLLLALALWHRPPHISAPPDRVPEAFDHTVAVLLRAPGAEWEETGLPTRAGAALPPGWLRLKSGLAHIEFYSGAMVILEGPAELQLISRMEAYCARGKLRATVPSQAQGFTIGTPKLGVVDRGTEFGLRVGRNGQTEVHVFQGKVELKGPGQADPGKALMTGQGLRVDGPGAERPIRPDSAAFTTAQELAARSRAAMKRRQKEWVAASAALRRDESLVAYYPFQGEAWSRTLLDQARGRRQPHDGAIVGCSWVTGRWPGKQGLEFKRVSDRVRLHVPGAFDSITLAIWVRVDALPNSNNSLLMSDGWNVGGLHWQIGDDGTIILGVKAPGQAPNAHYHATGAFKPERLGQWSHLAVVYDRDAGWVTHYLDGRPVAQVLVQFDLPLRIGDANIGNWNLAARRARAPIRYLSGCVDELMVFSRALSDREIERLYTQGQPPL
jgi:hypothetical protein